MKKALLFLIVFSSVVSADSFDRVWKFLLIHERSTYCHDGGWESKYGISKQVYPREDIKNLTEERAREICRKDYWEGVGANIMFDTMLAFVSTVAAFHCGQPIVKRWLRTCLDAGGIYEAYVDHLARLIKEHPEKYGRYTKTWMLRVADLKVSITTN